VTDNYSVHSLERWNCLYLVVKCVEDNVSVSNGSVLGCCLLVCERVHHPLTVLSLSEVISGVCTSRLLSVFGCVDNHLAIDEQVLKLKCLDEVGVPHLSSVADFDVVVHLGDFVHFSAALLKPILSSEYSSMSLHSSLELVSNLGSAVLTVRVSHLI